MRQMERTPMLAERSPLLMSPHPWAGNSIVCNCEPIPVLRSLLDYFQQFARSVLCANSFNLINKLTDLALAPLRTTFNPQHLRAFPPCPTARLGERRPIVLPVAGDSGEKTAMGRHAFMRAQHYATPID